MPNIKKKRGVFTTALLSQISKTQILRKTKMHYDATKIGKFTEIHKLKN